MAERGLFRHKARDCVLMRSQAAKLIGRRSPLLMRAAIGLALLALPGCADFGDFHGSGNGESRLFTRAYERITDYYIEPTTSATLALAGLGKLGTIDPSITIENDGSSFVLYRGTIAHRFPAPRAGDAPAWGELTADVVDVARSESPAIAATPLERVEEAVLDGSVGTLDRFSHYAAPDVARDRRASRDGFYGIGVTLDNEAPDVRIVQVLPDTPAAAAGLHAEDRIVAIDGIATATLTREEVVRRLRGPLDSHVLIAVIRPGVAEPFTLSVPRARIVVPTVMLSYDDGIARFRISSFNQSTGQSLADLLQRAHHEMGGAMRGIVLDLRGNPGGLLDQSIEVASLFLDGNVVASTIGRNRDSNQSFPAEAHHKAESLPIAVLVNGGSASASEIVAAALQDRGRAVLIGTASYGKGTVQSVFRLPNDGELTVTWARLVAPGGYILHEHGVVPAVCTADIADNADGAAEALRRSALAPTPPPRRAQLDEQGWRALRQSCPAQSVEHDVDLQVARQILSNPALYSRLLYPPSPGVSTASLVR